MRNLLLFCGVVIWAGTACAQIQAPIQSLSDVQPYLEKHLGTPTKVDTLYKGIVYDDFTTLVYRYKNRPDLSYQKIADVLSEGFGEPAYVQGKSKPPILGGLIPLEKTCFGVIYKVQFGVSSQNPPSCIICISDDKNEIPIPEK